MPLRPLLTATALAATLALAGCDSAEERAEKHYQSALSLMQAGDEDRALVELRNVFDLDGFHQEARRLYADTLMKRGQLAEAYSQYLRLIEQYPDTPEVRLILAQIAFGQGNWSEVERHGREAQRLAPDLPGVAEIGVVLDYRAATMARDAEGRRTAAEAARAVLTGAPDSRLARRILIDWLATGDTPAAALPEIERALELDPRALDLHGMKLRLLAQGGDDQAVGAALRRMFELFPDNAEVRGALVAWHLSQRDIDGAEALLRRLAGEDTAAPEGHVAVIQLVQQARGHAAAEAELDRLIAANAGQPHADLYRALKAAIGFEAGERAAAVAEIEAVLAAAQPSDQTRRIKLMLARMLVAQGDRVGARARVEEVLAEDRTQVEALKMRAAWLIDEDRPGEAILDLRAALDQTPRDAEILTLMAQAHERDGAADLAGERLALAVEVSGAAAPESLRYARFLMRQGRPQAAEAVLADARRVNPGNVEVLAQLADLFVNAQDWARAQELVGALQALGTPEAERTARALQATLLIGQNRTEDGIAMLDEIASSGGDAAGAVAMAVQAQLRAGKPEAARAQLDEALAARPDDPRLLIVSAGLYALEGKPAETEAIFRDLLSREPGAETPARLLYSLLRGQGRDAEALAVVEAALAAAPKSMQLRWILAGEKERAGDIDAAIAVYDEMYAEDSSNLIVANNLASLIATHRGDTAGLERAHAIARRLRGSTVPAFQDTYGWIAYRRGDLDEALAHLEPAAQGLPEDALVQYHLGMTYLALKREAEARAQFERALELAGDSPLPQFETAREELAKLPPAPAEPAAPAP